MCHARLDMHMPSDSHVVLKLELQPEYPQQPSLLLRGNGLVKTKKFKDAVYVGDPVNAVRIFSDKEADEIVILDIDASREGREPNYELIAEMAGEAFMPVAYGGGVRSLEQVRRRVPRHEPKRNRPGRGRRVHRRAPL